MQCHRSAFIQYYSPPKLPQRTIMPILCLKNYDNRGPDEHKCGTFIGIWGSGHLGTRLLLRGQTQHLPPLITLILIPHSTATHNYGFKCLYMTMDRNHSLKHLHIQHTLINILPAFLKPLPKRGLSLRHERESSPARSWIFSNSVYIVSY